MTTTTTLQTILDQQADEALFNEVKAKFEPVQALFNIVGGESAISVQTSSGQTELVYPSVILDRLITCALDLHKQRRRKEHTEKFIKAAQQLVEHTS